MVNDNMVKPLGDKNIWSYVDGCAYLMTPLGAAQAVVNEAWATFDKDDESTWPKTIDPSDVFPWVVSGYDKDGQPCIELASWFKHNGSLVWRDNKNLYPIDFTATRYANPVDVMYKEIE